MGRTIHLQGARTHNLKGITVTVPHRTLTVVTGVSGSGKSSLAFDTLYAEGQMRYVESLSAYSRQFLEQMERPPVDSITGLPPAIALEQKNTVKNARSTVGTATELADYLRLLFASVGETTCPACGVRVEKHTVEGAVEEVLGLPPRSRLLVLAPVPRDGRPWDSLRRELQRQGFRRLWLSGPQPGTSSQVGERVQASARMVDVAEADEGDLGETLEIIIDRIVLAADPADSRSRAAEALEAAFKAGHGRAAVAVVERASEADEKGATGGSSAGASADARADKQPVAPGAGMVEPRRLAFDIRFNCPRCGREFPEPDPQLFSFNSAVGACPECEGFGRISGLDPQKIVPDPRKSIDNGAITCWQTPAYKDLHRACRRACHARGIRTDVPYMDLSDAARQTIWEGDEYDDEEDWPGIRGFFEWLETKRYKVHVRVMIARYRGYDTCPACGGKRLRPEALNVRVGGATLADLSLLAVADLRAWFDALTLPTGEAEKVDVVLREIRARLAYLVDVGLEYLTLDRQTRTLSGGEAQRINLASALGSSLTNTLYVLDEPTVGLHARDTHRLVGILRSLIAKGNTVVVVEHDPEVIAAADYLLDLGPGAGEAGGEIIYQGPADGLADCEASLTARWMATHADRAVSPYGRSPRAWITLRGARRHNLKHLDVQIPLGVLCCVTGVSGSGKTTLVHDCLYGTFRQQAGEAVDEVGECDETDGFDAVDDVVLVDSSPIGQSTRSNPVTYVKAYGPIRSLLAEAPRARVAGITPAHFSFNVSGGRCEECKGVGTVTYDMYFMADVTVVCQACGGKRFKKKVLDVRYGGKNIDDILEMTVDEAMVHFADHARVTRRLQPLVDVGLGYIRLGQHTASLSGGEAQRLKLASYLAAPKKGQQYLFIFDEPTTGLHMADVQVLLKTFHRLVHAGHSLLVVEHNLDFISQADWLIDLGPEGGEGGGRIVAEGPVEDVAACEASYTGRFLADRVAAAGRA